MVDPMLMLLLACSPSSDIEERLVILEAENAALQERIDALEDHDQMQLQQLARWEQTMAMLQMAMRGQAPALTAPEITPELAPESATGGDEDSGIEKTGDNTYTIKREVLDQLEQNPEELYSQLRVLPHKDENGDNDGFRLSGVRRDSFFYKIGLKNGDIVHSVNGYAITSTNATMEAYEALGEESIYAVSLTRRGRSITITIHID